MAFTVLFTCAIWPEPTSSAAGVRTRFLIDSVRRLRPDWQVVVHASGKDTAFRAELEASLGVRCVQFLPNDPAFDVFLRELDPSVVVFDRFMLEEQFGWRVRENAPRALRLLDTTDLHFLRRAREDAPGHAQQVLLQALTGDRQRDFFRETAAILRCDHSFVVSSFERDLLWSLPGFPKERVGLLRWGVEPLDSGLRPFEERRHFVMIGNFRHAPNRDSVRWVRDALWSQIRKRLPGAELHVYGAYPSRQDMELQSERDGFLVHGPWGGDARELLTRYRVLLAPLRFGAGIKGKILDAWAAGTAVVTSPIGAEGMLEEGAGFPGAVLPWEETEAWASQAVALHEEPGLWEAAQTLGREALAREYDPNRWAAAFVGTLERELEREERPWNWLADLLHQQEQSAAKSLSRYIEVKEQLRLRKPEPEAPGLQPCDPPPSTRA